jgi:peptidoglycan/LPS O-acetylase OafA/YrhL
MRLFRPGRIVTLLAAVISVLALVFEERHGGLGMPRFLAAGIPAAVLVISMLLLERIYALRIQSRVIFIMGESSYVLYLIHPYIIYSIIRLGIHDTSSLSTAYLAVLIPFLLVVSAAIAAAIHVYFEKPVMSMLRSRLLENG